MIKLNKKLKDIGYEPTSKKEKELLKKLDKIQVKFRTTPIEHKKPRKVRIKKSSYSTMEKERDIFGNKQEWIKSHKTNIKKIKKD